MVVLMSFIYKVRMLNDGLYIIPLIFICAWGNDTCAYCVGMLIGKHKMFPRLSPKKSVEGFIGGIAGAVLLGLIYGRIFVSYLQHRLCIYWRYVWAHNCPELRKEDHF